MATVTSELKVRLPERRKILLIAPFKGEGGIKDMFASPNFGLYRLKSYIECRFDNVTVDVVDPNLMDIDFCKSNYDCIGFSMTHTTLENDISLVYRAKKESPDSFLMAGGVEATFIPDWLLEVSPLDCVVIGEGEEILENIISLYDPALGIASINSVAGVALRGVNGNAKMSAFGSYLKRDKFSYISSLVDFSAIPYQEFWQANAKLYENPDDLTIKTARIFTGNYCPHNCNFCSSTNFLDQAYYGEFRRSKKVKVVVLDEKQTLDMVLRVIEAHPKTKTIIFDDDNFTMTTGRIISVCRMILNAKRSGSLPEDLSFICQARIDNFKSRKSKEALALMKEAGFRMIMFGVESFSDKVLVEFGKRTDVNLVDSVLKATFDFGVKPLIYLILFSPGSLMSDVLSTVTRSLDYLSDGMEISINFYIMDIPGCHFQKEKDLYRQFHEIPINVHGREVKSITKSEWIYPRDASVRDFSERILNKYMDYESFFKERYGISHIPGRIYTYIIFYAILDALGRSEERDRLLKIFENFHAENLNYAQAR